MLAVAILICLILVCICTFSCSFNFVWRKKENLLPPCQMGHAVSRSSSTNRSTLSEVSPCHEKNACFGMEREHLGSKQPKVYFLTLYPPSHSLSPTATCSVSPTPSESQSPTTSPSISPTRTSPQGLSRIPYSLEGDDASAADLWIVGCQGARGYRDYSHAAMHLKAECSVLQSKPLFLKWHRWWAMQLPRVKSDCKYDAKPPFLLTSLRLNWVPFFVPFPFPTLVVAA